MQHQRSAPPARVEKGVGSEIDQPFSGVQTTGLPESLGPMGSIGPALPGGWLTRAHSEPSQAEFMPMFTKSGMATPVGSVYATGAPPHLGAMLANGGGTCLMRPTGQGNAPAASTGPASGAAFGGAGGQGQPAGSGPGGDGPDRGGNGNGRGSGDSGRRRLPTHTPEPKPTRDGGGGGPAQARKSHREAGEPRGALGVPEAGLGRDERDGAGAAALLPAAVAAARERGSDRADLEGVAQRGAGAVDCEEGDAVGG
jgi:hypothetical protein